MTLIQAKEPIATEILKGANVEEVLAKYFGLSLKKTEVKMVKDALQESNEAVFHDAIERMIERHSKHIGRILI